MGEFISCIDADIYKNDDGTMDCIWLRSFYGDMSQEEYEATGTALSVRRGCEYCYAMLEWKTKAEEENWKSTLICHGKHPDWPNEWDCIHQVKDCKENMVGYEVKWQLYKSLNEVVAAGWELIWSYFPGNKKIYEKEIGEIFYKPIQLNLF